MAIIEIIPKRNEIGKSLELADQYHAAFEYNDFFAPDVLDNPAQLDRLISFYLKQPHNRSNDTLHGVFLDITIHSDDSLVRQISDQRIRQSMEIAQTLGLRGVVFHTNLIANFYNKQYRQNWLHRNRDYFLTLTEEYPHIEIYMENMFDLEPDMFAAFGESVKDCPTVHLCLDVAHAHLSHTPIAKWFDMAHPYIRHIHINDNDGTADLHMAVGQGTINWSVFDQMIRRRPLPASLLIETGSISSQEQSLKFLKENHFFPFD